MSSETGLPLYKVISSEKFKRTLKNLKKSYKSDRSQSKFIDRISEIIEFVTENPRTQKLNNFEEPLPKGIEIGQWHFRKLTFSVPEYKGAKGGREINVPDK
ncbi:MAG: hypothetical protein HC919_10445 [Oscillatoriales cyanobacterium SM2_2_1]|nr:hypothetical protein [Oscillatoriales cyanobacterium SM2_2_1]